ncbi:hypothetical protein EJB05_57672, partial [Eragrostis curvula]
MAHADASTSARQRPPESSGGLEGSAEVERRMVLHQSAVHDVEMEDEEVCDFEFDPGEEGMDMKNRWLAVGRFYSGQRYYTKALFDEMADAWGPREAIKARPLEGQRYMLEFEDHALHDYVVHGGPWRHKGDALIVVAYDGFTPPSEVEIEHINLWVRIYNVPENFMTTGFARTCGEQLGEVVTVGGAIRNFLRVRVKFPLEKVLKRKLLVRIPGRGIMTFKLKYENVPYFCFICGRIGHDKNQCPDEELAIAGVAFGTELRASPLKRNHAREIKIPAVAPSAKRGFNYSGAQKENIMTAASSSRSSTKRGSEGSQKPFHGDGSEKSGREEDKQGETEDNTTPVLPTEVQDALETGVQNIHVQSRFANIGMDVLVSQEKGRVSYSGDYDLSDASSVE